MVVQLTLVGMVLTTLFSLVAPLWTGLAAVGMVLFAGHEAVQRRNGSSRVGGRMGSARAR
jgi:putative ABC transport system permease protein